MKKFRIGLIALAITSLFSISSSSLACTDFRVTAKDGSVVIARSMEFGLDLQSNLRSSNRGRAYNTQIADGKPGLAWKAKYGYVFLDGLNTDAAIDGMNEAGLSFEALYLPNYAQYQTIPSGQESNALPYINFGDWVLSNFKTVDEVRQALPNVLITAQKIPGLGDTIFPLHFSIFDASGKGMVVEYVGGKLTTYDNKIGVMTNSPTYDWHLKNLVNYVHLAPVNPPAVIDNGMTFIATGQGYGMVGLPGDISPPSRFVKVTALLRTALPVADAPAALNLAEHIINNVDIPRGLVREPDNGNKSTNEITEWVVFKDLTNKNFYYRTYGDMSLHAVALGKVDFSESAKRLKMPIASKEYVRDMTDQFLKSPLPNQLPAQLVKE